jgi:tripartite-type tricarboxylate transporter receptor subunit TctC
VLPQLPHVPSAGELGFKDLVVVNWNAFLTPTGTPSLITDKLHDAIVKAGRDPIMIEGTRDAGAEIATSTPAAASALLANDLARSTSIAKDKGLKVE